MFAKLKLSWLGGSDVQEPNDLGCCRCLRLLLSLSLSSFLLCPSMGPVGSSWSTLIVFPFLSPLFICKAIIHALDDVCDLLPSKAKAACLAEVKKYVEQLALSQRANRITTLSNGQIDELMGERARLKLLLSVHLETRVAMCSIGHGTEVTREDPQVYGRGPKMRIDVPLSRS